MTNSPSELIIERKKTHGDFRHNAEISQKLKLVIDQAQMDYGHYLNKVQAEALDMICLKISRICSGQADYADHWADIAGYAKLAEQYGMAIPYGGKDSSPGYDAGIVGLGKGGIFSDENEL